MIKVRIENQEYLNDNGTLNIDKALTFVGHIAGICYAEEGYDSVLEEDIEKTLKRANDTIGRGHHSVVGHLPVNLYIKGQSKLMSMILNNEKEYNTSERSLRYTSVKASNDSIISEREVYLYNKWVDILKIEIVKKYPNQFKNFKIRTLAQENARKMVTVFMPTEMIYTTNLRQLNYIASWMLKYIKQNEINPGTYLDSTLAAEMKEFLAELERLNLLIPGLMINEKCRGISLFGTNLSARQEYYGDIYLTKYKAPFDEVAQAHRHRTINYQIEIPSVSEYAIPEIIKDNEGLVEEWIKDISSLNEIIPIGTMVDVVEWGDFDGFILKCKERLCSCAQLDVMKTTRNTLMNYKNALEEMNHPLALEIEKYSKGARCTFPDYTCSNDCKFKEGKILTRKI